MEVADSRFVGVETAGVELLDVGIVDNPGDIALAVGGSEAVHAGACYHAETAAGDVALGIVVTGSCISGVEASEVELVEVTARNRHWRMVGVVVLVLVRSAMELLEPNVATHMEIGG